MRNLIFIGILIGITLLPLAVRADAPATAPAVADTPDVAEVRKVMIGWDNDFPKMTLEQLRKTMYTETERKVLYADYNAHEIWEANRTEQAVRDKWGPEGDAKFAHTISYSSREDDAVCHIKIDGNKSVVTWDLKDMSPEYLIEIDGHWMLDNHASFVALIKDNPTIDTDKISTGKILKQARQDIADGKFDDVDAFVADFKNKWENPLGN